MLFRSVRLRFHRLLPLAGLHDGQYPHGRRHGADPRAMRIPRARRAFMELKIQVCADDSCKVIVKDITEVGDNGYLPESSAVTVKNRFKYSDTVSIDVLQYNKTTGPEVQVPTYTEQDVYKRQP